MQGVKEAEALRLALMRALWKRHDNEGRERPE